VVPNLRDDPDESATLVTAGLRVCRGRPALHQLVPWFIVGFLVMVAVRSANLIPAWTIGWIGTAATVLTVISMAALGLGVDVRTVSRAGGRITITAILSLLVLGSASFGLIRLLGL